MLVMSQETQHLLIKRVVHPQLIVKSNLTYLFDVFGEEQERMENLLNCHRDVFAKRLMRQCVNFLPLRMLPSCAVSWV